MLTDFGISKLLTELTVGQTLAGFWSGGYASPEQRSGSSVGTASDIYSLGAVFYHLLSGNEPPPEGPTSDMADQLSAHPLAIRNILKRMLAQDPDHRLSRGSELLPALEAVTRQREKLPRHFLILTNTAIRNVLEAGLSFTDDFQSVAELITEDLGGMERSEIQVQRDRRNDNDIILLGDSLRLICTPGEEGDALVVKAIHTPYGPDLEGQKARAMPHRAVWETVNFGYHFQQDSNSSSLAIEELNSLLSRIDTHETVGAVSSERWRSRRDFIERWNIALSRSRSRIEREATSIRYSEVSDEGDHLRFTLAHVPPDDLGWDDDTPLAIREDTGKFTPVGDLIGIRGRMVEVTKQVSPSLRSDKALPKSGLLTTNTIEALSANSRQSRAVRACLQSRKCTIIGLSSGRPIMSHSYPSDITREQFEHIRPICLRRDARPGPAQWTCTMCFALCCTYRGAAASGECCPATFPSGKPATSTTGNGARSPTRSKIPFLSGS